MIDRDKLGASADSEDMANAGKPTADEAPAPMRHDTLEAHPVRTVPSVVS